MAKSTVKKLMCNEAVKFIESLPIHHSLKTRDYLIEPYPSASIIDGSYFMVQGLHRFSKPSRSTKVGVDDLIKVFSLDELAALPPPSPEVVGKVNAPVVLEPPGTWQQFGDYFVQLIANEFVELLVRQPTEDETLLERETMFVPTVVFGIDKYSDAYKDMTGKKRSEVIVETLQKKAKVSEAKGCEPRRGYPIDIKRLLSDDASLNEPIPYPHEELFLNPHEKGKMNAFVSNYLYRSMVNGVFHDLVFMKYSGSRFRSQVFGLILDGHWLYPSDHPWIQNETDRHILNTVNSTDYVLRKTRSNRQITPGPGLDTIDKDDRSGGVGSNVKYGMDSPLFFTPISVYVHNIPTGGKEQLIGLDFGSNYLMGKRYLALTGDALQRSSLLKFLKKSLKLSPTEVISTAPNDLGEFDFVMFQYVHKIVHQLTISAVTKAFNHHITHMDFIPVKSSLRLTLRLVVEDTDAFVNSILATELTKLMYNVELFIKISGASKSPNQLAQILPNDPIRTKQLYNNTICYHIHHLTKTYSEMFPNSTYPTSNVAFLLYSKVNDYIPMGFVQASHEVMYIVYAAYYDYIGHDLIIDCSKETTKWIDVCSDDSRLESCGLVLDRDAFFRFWKVLKYKLKQSELRLITNPYSLKMLKRSPKESRQRRILPPPVPKNVTLNDVYSKLVTKSVPVGVVWRCIQLSFVLWLYSDTVLGEVMKIGISQDTLKHYGVAPDQYRQDVSIEEID